MSTLTFESTAATANEAAQRSKADTLQIAAVALLSIRFIQGFVYWGGGSRRFIYAPAKLDPHAASWMANKFQSAMPGALLGTDHIIAFLLHHFYLLRTGRKRCFCDTPTTSSSARDRNRLSNGEVFDLL